MIIKFMDKHTTQAQSLYIDERDDGVLVLGLKFDTITKQFAIETADDLGRLLQVLIGCEELDIACKGELTIRHTIDPSPGYWLTLGPGSAGKRPQDNEFAFFITPAEALVLIEALRAKCAKMLEA